VYVIVTAPFFPLLVPAGRSSIIENGAKLSSILSAYSQDVSEIFRQIISKSGIYIYLVLFIIENEANMFLFTYACMRTMYMHKIFLDEIHLGSAFSGDQLRWGSKLRTPAACRLALGR
jgi:hypothetical protein